jgi:hypothetical protein
MHNLSAFKRNSLGTKSPTGNMEVEIMRRDLGYLTVCFDIAGKGCNAKIPTAYTEEINQELGSSCFNSIYKMNIELGGIY